LHWRFALLAMCLDISVEPCQNPSRPVWKAFGTAFMMRSAYHRPSRIAFQPSSLRCPSHKLPKRKSAFELRRSVVPVEIVDGLSEVAGKPLALRVARRRDERVWAARAGQSRRLSFGLKARVWAGWTG
jgi:hypothetical protein